MLREFEIQMTDHFTKQPSRIWVMATNSGHARFVAEQAKEWFEDINSIKEVKHDCTDSQMVGQAQTATS